MDKKRLLTNYTLESLVINKPIAGVRLPKIEGILRTSVAQVKK